MIVMFLSTMLFIVRDSLVIYRIRQEIGSLLHATETANEIRLVRYIFKRIKQRNQDNFL